MTRAVVVGCAAALLLLIVTPGPAGAGDPAMDYLLNCQGCHRADGAGTPGSVPALKDSVARFLALPEGRTYLARVPGVSQAGLDDDATAALLTWLVRRFDPAHVPADFQPYTAAEIAPLRRAPLVDVDRVRAGLLERIAARP